MPGKPRGHHDNLGTVAKRNYDWPRFWVPLGATVDISDGGYLLDPLREGSWSTGTKLQSLAGLAGYRALGLLGEPGMGKSVALRDEAARISANQKGEDIVSLHIDLRAFSSDSLLYAKVFESSEIQRWKEGSGELVLHLDSLDEALLRIDTVASLIAAEVPKLPVERLRVRIACRTAVWPGATLEAAFSQLWGEDAVGSFEIAPLRRTDVRTAAELWPIDGHAFLEQVRIANVIPFAIKPLTLDLLLRLFERDGRLPDGAAGLYRQGCLTLCEERGDSRRDARRTGRLSAQQRYRLAGRLAAVSMFANRYAVWTGPEPEIPSEDVALAALAIGEEEGDFRSFDVTAEAVAEILDTGLFSSRGEKGIGWAHQSYAEFLAADYLIGRKVSAENILKVLRHPSGGLVPQLSMVTAWASSLVPEVRRELIATEPLTLLFGDLSDWPAEDLASLTDALLAGLSENRFHDVIWGIGDRYRKLAHPGLAAQLRPYILEPGQSPRARSAALRIAEACAVTKLQKELVDLALDEAAEPNIRASAVSALESCGDEAAKAKLVPLALGGSGPDPDNEIKGRALQLLWPDHLKAADLFAHLTPPREHYFGGYAAFLREQLPPTLTRDDLPSALAWATGYVAQVGNTDEFQRKGLADSVLLAAWDHVQDPEIAPLIVGYVSAVTRTHYELFLGIDRDQHGAFRARAAVDQAGRRSFLEALLATSLPGPPSYLLRGTGLLLREDLPWLLSLAPSAVVAVPNAIDEAALCDLVQGALDLNDETHFGALYEAAEHWPMLRARYSYLLDGVPLDSPAAEEAKRYERLLQEHADRRPPKLDPPPAERVRAALDRFEAGDARAWPQLNLELTLNAESRGYMWGLEYQITKFAGWVDADDATRKRILACAVPYLKQAEPALERWLGTNSYNLERCAGDFAAYRALVLLREVQPDIYEQLTPALWRRWAPLAISVPRETGTEAAGLYDAIAADAMAKAPEEAVATVIRLIHSERERQTAATQPLLEGIPSFLFLREIDATRTPPVLRNRLLAELGDERNTPKQTAALLEFLLQAGVAKALDYALGFFSEPPSAADRDRALAVAVVLLDHDSAAAWSVLWPVLTSDQLLGRDVFLQLAHQHRGTPTSLAGLTEAQLSDFYVWLQEQFPHSDDPHQPGSGVHGMGPRDSVAHLRDGVLGTLIQRGTPEAVAALRTIMGRLPHLGWLVYQLMEADQLMRLKTWAPMTPREVLGLVDAPHGRLIQTPEDLRDLLVSALRGYEAGLYGEQTPVRDLWDRQADKSWRPIAEDPLSDHVKRHLKERLAQRGVVVNREVEIGRVPGAAVGSRTDIRIDAVRRSEGGKAFDAITAVIETKGCWNQELMTAIETQLHDDYLVRLGAPVGIYLVGWFEKANWDSSDYRRGQSPSFDVAEAQRRLNEKAAALSGGFLITALVLDCRTPGTVA
jgi:hypothetical protein